MKCPHCLEGFHETWDGWELQSDVEAEWGIRFTTCPECKKLIVELTGTVPNRETGLPKQSTWLVRPKAPSRAPLDKRIPEEFARDYREAALVLADSPKASAALSRACLQHLLREKAGVDPSSLDKEIEEAMPSLPSYLADAIDGVRVVGNYAAHPSKRESTGEVVEVEPTEAEWNLDTLEGLFDHYFVQPELLKEKRDEMNKKLADIGKPPLKTASSGEDESAG